MPTNAVALSSLLAAERPALVRWVARIVGMPAAEDIAQSVYLRIQRVEDHPPIRNKRSFLFRLARNLAIDHVRGQRREGEMFVSGADGSAVAAIEPSAETRLIDQERVRHIAAAVERMPLRCRQVFVLTRLDELSVAETAARLAISQDMVRKHIRHALMLCHQALADAPPEPHA